MKRGWNNLVSLDVGQLHKINNFDTRIKNMTEMIRDIYLKKEGGCSVGTSSVIAHEL